MPDARNVPRRSRFRRAAGPCNGRVRARSGARPSTHRRRAPRAARADRRRERRAARSVDGHLGACPRVAARQARRAAARVRARPGREPVVDAPRRLGASRSSSAATSTPCRTAAGSTAASTSLAAVEVVRRIAEDGTPPVTIRLVDWADEEGARFGRSLFGSSAASGTMADQDELRGRTDADGIRLEDALARARRRPRPRARGGRRSWRAPPPISSCTSSRAPCSSRWISRSAP